MSLNAQHQIKSTGRRQAGLPTGQAGFSLIELPVVRKGFSLIELLVIITIIALLIGILFPSITRVQISVLKRITHSRMGWIEAGCEEFKHDFGQYPPSGPESIAQAMTGYKDDTNNDKKPVNGSDDDGKKGLGFRIIDSGRVYGPYGPTVDIPMEGGATDKVFLDGFENTIYYYRYDSGAGAYDTDGVSNGPTYISKIPQYRKNIALMSLGPKKCTDSSDDWSTFDGDNPDVGFSDVTNFLPE
jgi:prepilin-type N-terminal cleavage/methylation domain-containing protein